MRILVMTLRYPPHTAGGYELLTENAVEGLRERGHEVHVLSGRGSAFTDPHVHDVLMPQLDKAGDLFELHRSGTPRQRFGLHFFRWANFFGARRVLRGVRPDVVLFFNQGLVSLAPLIAARLHGVPRIGYICDPWAENLWLREMRNQPDKALQLPLFEVLWKCMRGAAGLNRLLVASSFLKRGLVQNGWPKQSLELVSSGLSVEMDRLGRAGQVCERKRGEPIRVICTSMLWDGKGQHVLVQAFGRAVAEGLDGELVLAGSQPAGSDYRKLLEGLIAEAQIEERVRFAGLLDVPQLSAELSASHIFVLPSIWGEPFGLATIEAMAHGVCTVVSDSGASPELTGDSGVVVPTGDVPALVRALLELSGDEERRRSLAASGQARALKVFGRDAFIDRLEGALGTSP